MTLWDLRLALESSVPWWIPIGVVLAVVILVWSLDDRLR